MSGIPHRIGRKFYKLAIYGPAALPRELFSPPRTALLIAVRRQPLNSIANI